MTLLLDICGKSSSVDKFCMNPLTAEWVQKAEADYTAAPMIVPALRAFENHPFIRVPGLTAGAITCRAYGPV